MPLKIGLCIIYMFNTFRTKLTLSFLLALMLVIVTDNFFIYKFNFNTQFYDLRDKLKSVSSVASLLIDADTLMSVPLNRDALTSPQYKEIEQKLILIKKSNPGIKYIYTITKSDVPGTWRFIVDPDALTVDNKLPKGASSFPGDTYDASRIPEMLAAYDGPSADKKIMMDQWGASLSGYAPIRDKTGKTVAVLGIDLDAGDVYALKRSALLRTAFVLSVGILFSLILAWFISKRISKPLMKLAQSTRRIASGNLDPGNLDYGVDIKGRDEIAQLAAEFNGMASSLSDVNKKLRGYFYGVVQSLVRSLEAKDHYTRGHSDRVSDYSVRIAQVMGFSAAKIDLLKKAAQLHDIGKIGVKEEILNKSGALNDEERRIINEHPKVGEEILSLVFDDTDLLSVVRSHHEHFDGKGYPDHLVGGKINTSAQIVAVADAFDAMTSTRPYRSAMSKVDAINIIKQESGTQFNPEVVKAFIESLEADKKIDR